MLGDVVLARKDIGIAYHLAVVIDDAAQNITHVTRGDDLLSSTHVHVLLQHLLGLPQPLYLHHELICDDQGKRLAKRYDALSLRSMREAGLCADQIMERLRPILDRNLSALP
jgi:glutamyl-Q tRNA(Asp) synthetase